MLTITTLVRYRQPAPEPPAERRTARVHARRDRWRAEGLCLQCGGERPCAKHAAAAKAYRDRKVP